MLTAEEATKRTNPQKLIDAKNSLIASYVYSALGQVKTASDYGHYECALYMGRTSTLEYIEPTIEKLSALGYKAYYTPCYMGYNLHISWYPEDNSKKKSWINWFYNSKYGNIPNT